MDHLIGFNRLNVLILGGSSEASALARALSGDGRFDAVLSLAGRTKAPQAQPITTRVGGFGGVAGLADYLNSHNIDALIDATHPFAAQMSCHAIAACAKTGTPLLAVERAPWRPTAQDLWHNVPDVPAAIAALGDAPKTVFCGLGRLALAELQAAPQHRYVIRVIDAPGAELNLPHAQVITARGPFTTADDIALFQANGVEAVLSKNAGGSATVSKIQAARALQIPIIMVERPAIPPRPTVETPEAALQWLIAQHQERIARGV